MSQSKHQLTPTEWEIMEAVWRLLETEPSGEISVRDVVDRGVFEPAKAYTTVQTLMNTLQRKGVLKRRKVGLVNFYRPVFERREMVDRATSSLLDRLFEGSGLKLVNFMMDNSKLSGDEIEALQEMINRHREEEE